MTLLYLASRSQSASAKNNSCTTIIVWAYIILYGPCEGNSNFKYIFISLG